MSTPDRVVITNHDSVYPLKLAVSSDIDVLLPKRQVAELLESLGYTLRSPINVRRLPEVVELRNKEGRRAFLTDRELAFDHSLPTKSEEQLRAQIFSLLVARIWILNQAARQNAGAAKLNLLQNQRRACVSDSYYALFLALGSLIELTKQSFLTEVFSSVEEGALKEDHEDRRLHFTPEHGGKLASRWNELADATFDNQVELRTEFCCFPTVELSRYNPFVWLLVTGAKLLDILEDSEPSPPSVTDGGDDSEPAASSAPSLTPEQIRTATVRQEFSAFVELVKATLSDVNVDSFAIGVSNREKFEEQFSTVFRSFYDAAMTDLASDNEYFVKRGTVALLECFYLYAYALRQMADYEASFDSRIGIQTVGHVCHLSDWFARIIEAITDRRSELAPRATVDQLNVSCSPDVVGNLAMTRGYDTVLGSIGGVIIARDLDLTHLAKSLLSKGSYAPALIDGRLCTFTPEQAVVLNRALPFTDTQIRVTITPAGALWFDLVLLNTSTRRREALPDVSTVAFKGIIVQHILGKEIMAGLPQDSSVYLGSVKVPTCSPSGIYDFAEDLIPGSLSFRSRSYRSIVNELENKYRGKLDVPLWEQMAPLWVEHRDSLEKFFYVAPGRELKAIVVFHWPPLDHADRGRLQSLYLHRYREVNKGPDPIFCYIPKEMLDDLLLGDTGNLSEYCVLIADLIVHDYLQTLHSAASAPGQVPSGNAEEEPTVVG